jgi:hypothetical protein
MTVDTNSADLCAFLLLPAELWLKILAETVTIRLLERFLAEPDRRPAVELLTVCKTWKVEPLARCFL